MGWCGAVGCFAEFEEGSGVSSRCKKHVVYLMESRWVLEYTHTQVCSAAGAPQVVMLLLRKTISQVSADGKAYPTTKWCHLQALSVVPDEVLKVINRTTDPTCSAPAPGRADTGTGVWGAAPAATAADGAAGAAGGAAW